MKKKISVLLAAAMVLGLAGCAGSGQKAVQTPAATEAKQEEAKKEESAKAEEKSEEKKETIVLKWGDAAVEGTAEYEANEKFIELVEQYTDGQVKIEYYPAGQLGADGDVVQACMANTLELAKCSTANLSEFTHILDFCDFPGMFRDTDHVYQVLGSDLRDELAMQV